MCFTAFLGFFFFYSSLHARHVNTCDLSIYPSSLLKCPSIYPPIHRSVHTICANCVKKKETWHWNTTPRYMVSNKINCSPAPTHFIEVTTLMKTDRVWGTRWLMPPNSGRISLLGFAWKKKRKYRRFSLLLGLWSGHASHYKMFVIYRDKSTASTLKSKVGYGRKTRGRHRSCRLASHAEKPKPGEWNKFRAMLASAYPILRTVVAAKLLWCVGLYPGRGKNCDLSFF